MFDWREYLDLARILFTHPLEPAEASWRTTASRAYYAAFHKCRLMLEEREGRIAGPGSHSYVVRQLRRRVETEAAAATLNRIFKLRINADYYSDPPFTERDAEMALELAVELLG